MSSFLKVTFACALIAGVGRSQKLGPDCTVTVNGQSVKARTDGSFRVRNIPSGDDLHRLRVVCKRQGVTYYGITSFFQVTQNESFALDPVIPLTTVAPIQTVAINAVPAKRTLTKVDETTQVSVTAILSNQATRSVTMRSEGTTYRSSDEKVATVDNNGLVTAKARGIAYITARNEGATSVAEVEVVLGSTTTVKGYVEFADNKPVAGADILIPRFALSTKAGSGGAFEFKGVPATAGNFAVVARWTDATKKEFFGSTQSLDPIADGITDAGVIKVREVKCGLDSNLGNKLNIRDDRPVQVQFSGGFTFKIAGKSEKSMWVSPNGNLQFATTGDSIFNPTVPNDVVNGVPRVSPAFVDFDPVRAGGVYFKQLGDRVVVTWFQVALFENPGSKNTVQCVLHGDGRIEFIYYGLTADGSQKGWRNETMDISAAVSPCGTPRAKTVDLGLLAGSRTVAGEAAIENFSPTNKFDLDFSCIEWRPNSVGGYDIRRTGGTNGPILRGRLFARVAGMLVDDTGEPLVGRRVTVTSSRQSAVPAHGCE